MQDDPGVRRRATKRFCDLFLRSFSVKLNRNSQSFPLVQLFQETLQFARKQRVVCFNLGVCNRMKTLFFPMDFLQLHGRPGCPVIIRHGIRHNPIDPRRKGSLPYKGTTMSERFQKNAGNYILCHGLISNSSKNKRVHLLKIAFIKKLESLIVSFPHTVDKFLVRNLSRDLGLAQNLQKIRHRFNEKHARSITWKKGLMLATTQK